MRLLALLITFSALTIGGCADRAKPHIERFADGLLAVESRLYPQHDGYPKDEFKIRGRFERSQAINDFLTDFLIDSPPVGTELTAILKDWQTTASEIESLHTGMIEAKRFTYTADEEMRAEQLSKADKLAFSDVYDFLVSYE